MKSLAELKAIKEKDIKTYDYKILIGMATCGIAAGANPVMSEFKKIAQEKKLLGVEMESFALFHNANVTNKKAACLLTVSDSLVTNESTTPEERQTAFTSMMKIALEMAE